MKKSSLTRIAALVLALVMLLALTACGNSAPQTSAPETLPPSTTAPATTKAPETAAPETTKAPETVSPEPTTAPVDFTIRVGSLTGPTTMGLVQLMNENETEKGVYEFTIAKAGDELLAKMNQKELDIALLPANVAAIFYNKTNGGVRVIDINTLGVLYLVSADTSIKTTKDLEGRTVVLPGKGTTPDYALRVILSVRGLEDKVKLEYKSEAAEVAAYLAQNEDAVGLLPQPFVISALKQNDKLSAVVNLNAEWNLAALSLPEPSALVTGVTIVRTDFLESRPEAVNAFLADHAASAEYTNRNPGPASELIEKYGIVGKAAIAEEAIPKCNIVALSGKKMTDVLPGYYRVLFDLDPASVGGKIPGNDFYYIAPPIDK